MFLFCFVVSLVSGLRDGPFCVWSPPGQRVTGCSRLAGLGERITPKSKPKFPFGVMFCLYFQRVALGDGSPFWGGSFVPIRPVALSGRSGQCSARHVGSTQTPGEVDTCGAISHADPTHSRVGLAFARRLQSGWLEVHRDRPDGVRKQPRRSGHSPAQRPHGWGACVRGFPRRIESGHRGRRQDRPVVVSRFARAESHAERCRSCAWRVTQDNDMLASCQC